MKSKASVMTLKPDNQTAKRSDTLKWLLIVILLLAGLVANYYYRQISVPIRLGGWVVLVVLICAIAASTKNGKLLIEFFRDSRMEMRKVTWPTRQETIQTTLVVGAMVVILALILWGMDGILVWLIGWLTGQRG